MSEKNIDQAIAEITEQGFDNKDFDHFIEHKGILYPSKRVYAVLVNKRYQDLNTSEANRYFTKHGFKMINTNRLAQIPTIWKVSHSPKYIKSHHNKWLIENKYLTVHQDSGRGSGDNFIKNMKCGDIVSLCYGNAVGKIVLVTSEAINDADSPLDSEWKLRHYEEIYSISPVKPYEGIDKVWSPRRPNTCAPVPVKEIELFTQEILLSYYKKTLDDLRSELNGRSSFGEEEPSKHNNNNQIENVSLNQILYGPPGTGKTYSTIEAAVKAAEPTRFSMINSIKDKIERRTQLKNHYKALVDDGRIQFVTFHQSYGYEEFVEGLSAKVEGENVTYYPKKGVFREICKEALKHRETKDTATKDSFDDCWQLFLEQLEQSEIGVRVASSRSYFTITDVNDQTIRFDKSVGQSVHSLSIQTVNDVFDGKKIIKGGLSGYYKSLAIHLKNLVSSDEKNSIKRKNYVLIIDEINRGNISKVFGELITLIEPSKRLGKKEALSVVLPCTQDRFHVPDNLYIIGTMNTADRSLALMDTALRRRFDFVEMMPDYSALQDSSGNDSSIQGINLAALLKKMNERIEALYDREHTLGHAFFMPVVEKLEDDLQNDAFVLFVNIFQNKILPLLQEYFYEDWQKVRLVLGDNQPHKQDDNLRFVKEENLDLTSLFGGDVEGFDSEMKQYQLSLHQEEVWQNPLAYIGIYDDAKSAK